MSYNFKAIASNIWEDPVEGLGMLGGSGSGVTSVSRSGVGA